MRKRTAISPSSIFLRASPCEKDCENQSTFPVTILTVRQNLLNAHLVATASQNCEPATAVVRGDYLVFYDTLCPICRKSRMWLGRLDWLNRIDFQDIHDRERMAQDAPGVSYARALREIIVVTPEGKFFGRKVLGGFHALRAVAWVLPALWPALPLLYFPGVSLVGAAVYRWIAKNRYRFVDCTEGTCDLHVRALAKANLDEAEIAKIVAQVRQKKQ